MRISPRVVWALGVTQVIGYGTLYYAFGVLAPAISAELGWGIDWVYGALSLSLLAGGLLAPVAGRLMDRHGAARMMALGSLLAALTLVALALSPGGIGFALGLVAMESASALVLYAAAFAVLVERGGQGAQRSITHLTLIAGFASTLFWPLTAWLSSWLTWREVYLIYAGLNLLVCLPLHLWLARLPVVEPGPATTNPQPVTLPAPTLLPDHRRTLASGLLLAGFAVAGFVLSGILMHVVPLLLALGLGASGPLVTTLFGPAQVLSRFTNLLFGRSLRQTLLAILAAGLLPAGLLVLAGTAPNLPGALLFAVLFGLGSGLVSIVSGSLPLELFGREGYATRLGWFSAARQVASALAPFGIALMLTHWGTQSALWVVAGLGLVGMGLFAAVAVLARSPLPARLTTPA